MFMILESVAVLALAGCQDPGAVRQDPGRQTPMPKPIRVRCKEDARVRGTHVLLADLAEITAPDAARTRRLMSLSFGKRPNPSYNRILTRQEVRARLYKEGFLARDLQVEGAREIVVHPLSTEVRPKDILDVANPALEAVLRLGTADVEYEPRSRLRAMRVPPGRVSLDFKAEADGLPAETAARIDVKILVDGEVYQVVPVHYRLTRYYRVLVTSRVLRKDTPLGPHNLALERVEKPAGSTVHLTSFDQVKDRVSSRSLRSGQKLTLSDLARPAVIRKNQVVTLVSMSGRVKIATRVIALADGRAGGFIRVRTMHANSPRQLVARVHAPGLCVIQPLR